MPTFTYKCSECEHTFDFLSVNKQEPKCPECESEKVVKQFTMPNVIYKGSGFYKTDNT